jgi:hypothetical protein
VCHPSAYLNKVVVARRCGDLEIWNVKTRYDALIVGEYVSKLIEMQQEDLYHPFASTEYADFVEGGNGDCAEPGYFGASDWVLDGRDSFA